LIADDAKLSVLPNLVPNSRAEVLRGPMGPLEVNTSCAITMYHGSHIILRLVNKLQ